MPLSENQKKAMVTYDLILLSVVARVSYAQVDGGFLVAETVSYILFISCGVLTAVASISQVLRRYLVFV